MKQRQYGSNMTLVDQLKYFSSLITAAEISRLTTN